ncbi:MAG: TIGR02147 family protein [Fibrobacteria bacterium]|nr:TIGR02147 family protein [Fibrobacteria bacterium]
MKTPVFKYLDFKKFLDDSVKSLQNNESSFSYIAFAKEAGYTSPNLLQMIIQGKRKLPEDKILSTARTLKLKKQETEYFTLLVKFNQVTSCDDREYFFKKILRHPKYAAHTLINKNQYEYFDKWYYPIVRELVTAGEYTGNPLWITQRIYPRITVAEVERAIILLEKLKLIYKDTDDCWKSTDTVLQTPQEVSNLIASLYHKKILEIAGGAIENFNADERDMRSVTLRLKPENYTTLKQKFNEYWNEVLALAAEDDDSDMVYQVHFSLFPFVRKGKGRA